jgi:uncharacterized radical SAM superfamily Fe-S cluster-containing enzyme
MTLIFFTSCTKTFDFSEAEKVIDYLKNNNRITSLQFFNNTVIINNQKTFKKLDKIKDLNQRGFNYKQRSDYLKSLDISEEELVKILNLLKKTKAKRVDYDNNKAYFMMDSFLDSSKGYLYSIEDLEPLIHSEENRTKLFSGYVTILERELTNWFEVKFWN